MPLVGSLAAREQDGAQMLLRAIYTHYLQNHAHRFGAPGHSSSSSSSAARGAASPAPPIATHQPHATDENHTPAAPPPRVTAGGATSSAEPMPVGMCNRL